MKTGNLITLVSLFLTSTLCQADWMSEVDKKYQQRSPAQYAKVAEAANLITTANGNSEKSYAAVDLLVAVTKESPKFAPAYVQLARAVSNLGTLPNNDFDKRALQSQEQLLQKALAIEPGYDYAIALMGFTKMFQGKLDEAEKYYIKAEKMGTGYPYLKSQLSHLANKRGNYPLALELALAGYEQNKSTPNLAAAAITEILLAYQNLPGDTASEEEKWFIKRRELNPSAWNWQAHASFRLYRFGDYEKSIEYGTKALSIMNFGVGRYTLAAAYYKKWNDLKDNPASLGEANKALEIATAMHPDTRDMIVDFMNTTKLRSTGKALQTRGPSISR